MCAIVIFPPLTREDLISVGHNHGHRLFLKRKRSNPHEKMFPIHPPIIPPIKPPFTGPSIVSQDEAPVATKNDNRVIKRLATIMQYEVMRIVLFPLT